MELKSVVLTSLKRAISEETFQKIFNHVRSVIEIIKQKEGESQFFF